jgi:transposase InsO family protein
VKFAWIKTHGNGWPLTDVCRVLGVSRSGYYAWRDRPGSEREAGRVKVTERIRSVFGESRDSYGSPRVYRELKTLDVRVCENTVAKYMRAEGLCVVPRRRFVPQTTDPDHRFPTASNVLGRDFTAPGRDRKWVSDLTYVWTDEGWLYLSVVIDLFSRKVVGWGMSEDMKASSVAAALEMAVTRRRPKPGLLHHSDRGSQYACELYREVLDGHGMLASMSRPGNCYDNAVAESFFGTLKSELVHRTRYPTREQAKASLFEWIECWYNLERRHSSLGYLSPDAFEAQQN